MAALCARGSWLGGSLVSALSFVASITLLPGPLVLFYVIFVLLHFLVAIHTMTHKMSSCMLFSLQVGSLFSVFFVCFGLVVVLCVLFAWLLLLLVCCCFFLREPHWTVYRSTTSAFVVIEVDSLA